MKDQISDILWSCQILRTTLNLVSNIASLCLWEICPLQASPNLHSVSLTHINTISESVKVTPEQCSGLFMLGLIGLCSLMTLCDNPQTERRTPVLVFRFLREVKWGEGKANGTTMPCQNHISRANQPRREASAIISAHRCPVMPIPH